VSRQGRFRIRPDAGTAYLTLTARGDDQVPDLRSIIFDPVPGWMASGHRTIL
jgi:hypothetical protein